MALNAYLIGAILGVFLIAFLFLVYQYGQMKHAEQDGVVDMNDYQEVRQELASIRAVEEATEAGTREEA